MSLLCPTTVQIFITLEHLDVGTCLNEKRIYQSTYGTNFPLAGSAEPATVRSPGGQAGQLGPIESGKSGGTL
jgi:hypothetical protein